MHRDISLAKTLQASSPSAQETSSISSLHGVDIILGGHDHLYFVSKGVSAWEDYDLKEVVLGAEGDRGDVLVVKSGTDFRDLSELNLELSSTPSGSVRRKVIKRVTGIVTLGNVLEILPFEDPVVVLELDGAAIWDALESSLSTWPAQEGQVHTQASRRFPVISGLRVSWDSRREPGSRVLGVWTLLEKEESIGPESHSGIATPKLIDGELITRDDKRTYKIVTREYMAQGHDGFLALKGKPYLVDDESGQLMSSIVRKYFLGSHFVNMMSRRMSNPSNPQIDLQPRTEAAVSRETDRRKAGKTHAESTGVEHWKHAARLALQWSRRSRLHYQDQLCVCTTEHMSPVDAYDGQSIRRGEGQTKKPWAFNEEDIITVYPEIDGRLKDLAR
ncbi:hypothetical protein C0993_008088 [Termitomyces sp. T159_Od127]|nr:hypothetical protein C0993_008088 [Termitomyces sp. T159_Od127]